MKVGRSARHFAADIGTDFQKIVDGNSEAVSVLAYACGIDPKVFENSTLIRVEDREFGLAGERFLRDYLRRSEIRVCPACIADDIGGADGHLAAHMRVEWHISAIRACPHHNCALVSITAEIGRLHDFAWHFHAATNATALALEVEDFGPSELSRYILARLGGQANSSWLDRLPLYAAARAAEWLGALQLHGPHAKWSSLSERQLHEAGHAGAQIAAPGETSIGNLFEQCQRHNTEQGGAWGVRSVFGEFYRTLAHSKCDHAFHPLRDLLGEHIHKTMPFGPGEMVLGQIVTERRVHSIRSASLETGLHPKTLRNRLVALGVLDPCNAPALDERATFDAKATETILAALSTAMTMKDAAAYLGIPRPIHDELLAPPFVTPMVSPGDNGAKDWVFSKTSLDALFDRLTRNTLEAEGAGLVSIKEAARRCSRSIKDVVTLLFDGALTCRFRVGTARQLDSIFVDLDAVRSQLHAPVSGLSIADAAKRMNLHANVTRALAEAGFLPSRIEINSVTRLPQRVIEPADADGFSEKYVSLFKLAEQRGVHFKTLLKFFEVQGIHPIFDPVIAKARFYVAAPPADS